MNKSIEVVFLAGIVAVVLIFVTIIVLEQPDGLALHHVASGTDQAEAESAGEVLPSPVTVEGCMAIFPTGMVDLRAVSGLRHYELWSKSWSREPTKVIQFVFKDQDMILKASESDYRAVREVFPGCRAR